MCGKGERERERGRGAHRRRRRRKEVGRLVGATHPNYTPPYLNQLGLALISIHLKREENLETRVGVPE